MLVVFLPQIFHTPKTCSPTLAARGLEELFLLCLRKVFPAHPRSVGVVQEFDWYGNTPKQ